MTDKQIYLYIYIKRKTKIFMCFIYVLLVHVDEFDIEDDVEIDN